MQNQNARQHFEELLPWYVNATLDPDQRNFVEEYLAVNPSARDSMLEVERLRRQIRERMEAIAPEVGYANFCARLRAQAPGGARRTSGIMDAVNDWIGTVLRKPAYLAAVCIVLAQAGVIGALWHKMETGSETAQPFAEYRSLRAAPRDAAAQTLRITFRPSANEAEIRALLVSVSGSIVGGPGPYGDYLLSVEAHRLDVLVPMLAGSQIVENVTEVRGGTP